ncbi:protamine-like protein [Syngnathus scovelli]|uniref:protamine-like protein n=1 Tax=Syngnathus scovelli TaxID=161590 RepID=UPI0021102888|nr:protamine-like protein [Syngnathus scovelli]
MQAHPTMSVSIAPKSPQRPRKRTGPTVSILILNAISSYGGSRGVSLVALKKALKASGYDVPRNRARIRLALRRLVAKNVIMRTRGQGASGSFKLNPKPPGARKKGAVRTERRPKKKRRRARARTRGRGKGKGKGKRKRRKAQGRRAKRGRSSRRRKKATPARKRSTKKRRRRRRAPRRKTPKRTRRIRRKRPKSAKVQNRRRSRTSRRVY